MRIDFLRFWWIWKSAIGTTEWLLKVSRWGTFLTNFLFVKKSREKWKKCSTPWNFEVPPVQKYQPKIMKVEECFFETAFLQYRPYLWSKFGTNHFLSQFEAFNVAILTSITKVSQPVFAQARIQFLKDGLKSIYNQENVPEHPVLAEIQRGVELHKWRKVWMNRLINERLSEV